MLPNTAPEGRKLWLGNAAKINELHRSSVANVRSDLRGTGNLRAGEVATAKQHKAAVTNLI